MKSNKEKIEFWLHANQKSALKQISEETGYTVSELMRRGVEYIIRDLMPAINKPDISKTPYEKDIDNGKD